MKNLNIFKNIAFSLIFIMAYGTGLYGQYSTFAIDDASVYEASPDQTVSDVHGSNIFINNTGANDEVIALVKFDISGFAGKQLTEAKFSTRSDMNDGKTMTVWLVSAGNAFSRDTTTWNNKPSIGSTQLASVVMDQESNRKYYTENGTELIDYISDKLMKGDTVVSFALKYNSGDGGDLKWCGGAGDGSWGPQLEMTFGTNRSYYVVADGSIYEALPDQNVNAVHPSNIFIANTTGDDEVIALVQYELTGMAYKQIGEAVFSTRSDMNDGKTMTVKLTSAGDNFDRTVTWNTKPSIGSTELASVVMDQESGRKYWTETGTAFLDYINSQLAQGDETISLALQYKDGDGGDLKWCGGKGDGSYGPMLELDDVTNVVAAYSTFGIDDASVYEASPDQTVNGVHGSNIFINNTGANDEVIAFVKFDVSGFAGRQVTEVEFSTRSDMNDGKTMTVWLVSAGNAFTRDTTTWNNKPSVGTTQLASVVMDQESNRKYYTENGTGLIDYINDKLMKGDTVISFALKYNSGDGGDLKWCGGVGDGSYGPQLDLSFSEDGSYYSMADGTIYEALPDQNVNAVHPSNIFIANTAGDDEVIALVQFDLEGLAYSAIESATFSTRSDMNDGKSMTVKLTSAGDNFDRTVTWNTKPSIESTELATVVMDQESGRKYWIETGTAFVDYINSQLAQGDETISLALQYKDGDGGDLKWCGGKGDGSYGPMLEISSPSLVPDKDTLTVIADVYVDEEAPDVNHDASSDMRIRKDEANNMSKEVFLKFDISEVADAIVGKVSLRLYIAQHNSLPSVPDFYVQVSAVDDQSWLEKSITWNNKPARGKLLIEENVTWHNAGKDTMWASIDLTHYVNEAILAGNDSLSLTFHGKNDTDERLWMAESNWKNEAQLILDYTVEPPEQIASVVADAHVEQGNPDANFGGEADQHLINDDANNLSKWVYQKFDISKAYGDAVSATLKLYARIHSSASITTFDFVVYAVDDISWLENGITWNNKPDAGTMLFEATATPDGGWFNLTSAAFTDFVNNAIEMGKDSVSVVIKGKNETPGNRAWISGRTYKAPELILNYEKQVVQPMFSPEGGNYIASVDVEISTLTSGATIYYTLDGSDPDETSTEYTAPVNLTDTTIVKAIAYAPELKASPVASATYFIQPVGLPQFSPSAVPKYQPPLEVTISVEPEGSVIRYSDDGSDPTTLYTEPLILNQTTTIKAQAFDAGFTYSTPVVEVTYTIVPPTGTAGTGPGGVGFKDLSRSGQPELGLWLKPESLTGFSDGDDILEWADVSGNENDAYNTGTVDNPIPNTGEKEKAPPVFRADVLNGHPVAEMGSTTGEKGSLIVDDADNLDGGEGNSIFVVFKRNELFPDFAAVYQKRDIRGGDPTKQAYVLEMNGGADPNTMQYVIARDLFVRNSLTFGTDDYYIVNAGLNGDLGLGYFINDGLVEVTAAYGKTIQTTEATVIVGGFHAMSLAEAAYFNSTVNAAQTRIVHEYLAAKYGLELTHGSSATNLYTNENYTADLIGIGKETDLAEGEDEEHLHATGGALELKADAFTAAGDYVFAAHNGTATTVGANDVWNRRWYVQTAGNGGDVDMIFDFAKAGLATPSTPGDYILAHRPDEASDWTDLGITPTADGDKLVFPVAGIQDGYYVIGTDLPDADAIEDIRKSAGFEVYPNPAKNLITVTLRNDFQGPVNINIYDFTGRLASSGSVLKAGGILTHEIDISSLEKGIYMIDLRQGDKSSMERLIIQ